MRYSVDVYVAADQSRFHTVEVVADSPEAALQAAAPGAWKLDPWGLTRVYVRSGMLSEQDKSRYLCAHYTRAE